MNIFYIHHVNLSLQDGVASHVVGVSRDLAALGFDVTLISPLRGTRVTIPQVESRYLPYSPPLPLWLAVPAYELAVALLLLIQPGLWRRRSIIWIRRGALLVLPMLLARLFRVPAILEEQDALQIFDAPTERQHSARYRWHKRWLSFQYRMANHVCVVSQGTRDALVANSLARSDKIVIMPNGVDTEQFQPMDKSECRKSLDIPDDGRGYLCYAGSFLADNGVWDLLEAMPRLLQLQPQAMLLIIGGHGADAERMRRRIDELGIGASIRYFGHVPFSDVARYIGAADVCVAPHRKVRESGTVSRLKLYCYLACGRPLVLTDVPIEIDDAALRQVALQCKAGERESMATTLAQALAERQRWHTMGLAARQLAMRYSWKERARSALREMGLWHEGVSRE